MPDTETGKNLIYDYALKVNVIGGVSAADTGFLRMPLVAAKPKNVIMNLAQLPTGTNLRGKTLTFDENFDVASFLTDHNSFNGIIFNDGEGQSAIRLNCGAYSGTAYFYFGPGFTSSPPPVYLARSSDGWNGAGFTFPDDKDYIITTNAFASNATLAPLAQAVTFSQSGQTGIQEATKQTIASITDNKNIAEIFNGGLSKILVACANDLTNLSELYKNRLNDFFTIILSDDFTDEQKADADIGTKFKGVVFFNSADMSVARANAARKNTGVYFKDEGNMFYAFGKFLSQISWTNLQYLELIADDEIPDADTADILFEDRVSFSLKDSQSVNRLSFFAQGGQAIIAPYVLKEIELKLQSETVNWIALNRPNYSEADCSILAQFLQEKVIAPYLNKKIISSGSISITTEGGQNFIAFGNIQIPKPTALWRVAANLYNA